VIADAANADKPNWIEKMVDSGSKTIFNSSRVLSKSAVKALKQRSSREQNVGSEFSRRAAYDQRLFSESRKGLRVRESANR
jgi:hypothetical protein